MDYPHRCSFNSIDFLIRQETNLTGAFLVKRKGKKIKIPEYSYKQINVKSNCVQGENVILKIAIGVTMWPLKLFTYYVVTHIKFMDYSLSNIIQNGS